MNGIMNRMAMGLTLAAFVLAAGACTSRNAATRAPSSYGFGETGQPQTEQQWGAGQPGQNNLNNRMDGTTDAQRRGEFGDVTGRGPAGNGDNPREVLVQADREKLTRPLVPAMPVGMRQKVLQDMRTVFFAFDKSGLSEATRRQLDANSVWMRTNSHVVVRLIGHADERGTSEYNLALGMRRADKVREYLINRGISSDRLITVSYGEELPLKRGHDSAAWAKNRRVEFGLGAATAQR